MSAPARSLRRGGVAPALVIVALAVGGCGSSAVKPTAYVKSVCLALGNWKNTIQSAGVALQSSGAAGASRPAAKEDYQRFVAALVTATRRARDALQKAGTPSVPHGPEIARRLTGAFNRATHGLEKASAQAGAIRTDSATAFQLGASAVNVQIRSALEEIAHVTPGQSPELRRAAAKQPACQVLAG